MRPEQMKEKLSPQEKKRLSYKKDHRTHTGGDNRAWRKAWAARKGRVNRKYRRKRMQYFVRPSALIELMLSKLVTSPQHAG